jgi:hypothetical protein
VKTTLTRNEFIEIVDFGNDVMFEYSEKKFAIVMTEDGIDIAEQNTCANRQVFEDAAQLLARYKIDGIPLEKILQKCKFTYVS